MRLGYFTSATQLSVALVFRFRCDIRALTRRKGIHVSRFRVTRAGLHTPRIGARMPAGLKARLWPDGRLNLTPRIDPASIRVNCRRSELNQ
jgi:hypothetical protein